METYILCLHLLYKLDQDNACGRSVKPLQIIQKCKQYKNARSNRAIMVYLYKFCFKYYGICSSSIWKFVVRDRNTLDIHCFQTQ